MEHTPGLETSPPGSDTLDVDIANEYQQEFLRYGLSNASVTEPSTSRFLALVVPETKRCLGDDKSKESKGALTCCRV